MEAELEYNPETDLFNNVKELPLEVQEVLLNTFAEFDYTYRECKELEEALEPLGYTFDWYLDAEPYNLQRIED